MNNLTTIEHRPIVTETSNFNSENLSDEDLIDLKSQGNSLIPDSSEHSCNPKCGCSQKHSTYGDEKILIPSHIQGYFNTINTYECWVEDIHNDIIYARGREINDLDSEISFDFPIIDVDIEDRDLVEISSVFWWKIGIFIDKNGNQKNKSIIKFRRLPAWSEFSEKKAKKHANYLAIALGFENE